MSRKPSKAYEGKISQEPDPLTVEEMQQMVEQCSLMRHRLAHDTPNSKASKEVVMAWSKLQEVYMLLETAIQARGEV